MASYKPKGYKDPGAAQALIDSAPKDSDFNPYDYIDQSYYKNNARGRMAYQEDLAKLLYMAQINQEERMNEYNSPAEQAKRMREAGLNPDLLGVSGEPAANVAGYQGNPMDGTLSTGEQVNNAFGMMSSVTSMVLSIMNPLQGIFSAGNAIGLADSAMDLFQSAPTGMDIKAFIDSSPMSRRTKRRLKGFYDSYTYTEPFSARSMAEATDSLEASHKYWFKKLNPMYNPYGSDGTQEWEAYNKVMSPLITAENDYLLKSVEANLNKSEYDKEFYNSDSGASDRSALDSVNSYKKTQSDLYKSMKEPLLNALNTLKKMESKYEWAAPLRAALCAYFASRFGGLN